MLAYIPIKLVSSKFSLNSKDQLYNSVFHHFTHMCQHIDIAWHNILPLQHIAYKEARCIGLDSARPNVGLYSITDNVNIIKKAYPMSREYILYTIAKILVNTGILHVLILGKH